MHQFNTSEISIDAIDYSILAMGLIMLLLDLIALKIVLRHIFVLARTQFYYKATVCSSIVSAIAVMIDYWMHKYFASFKYCLLVSYTAGSLDNWAILSTILLLSNIYLEMRLETGSLRFNSPLCHVTLSMLLLGISFVMNLPFILLKRTEDASASVTPSKSFE